jgi:RNA polymerase sigma factor (sigma-70 family)
VTVDESNWLAERFEDQRGRLRAVAYRMLGSLSEADDAVQEAWLHVSRADARGVENLAGWLTTIVARICLDMLRSRKARREEPLSARLPDPIVSRADGIDPEQEALLADSIGLALLVVLDTLAPAERVAFVLHDVFGVPFDTIAPIVDRSPVAARQLASRARRRVRGAPAPDADLGRQRRVVDAFIAAARGGDFEGLLAVLDPDVVLRADRGAPPSAALVEIRGARAVAEQALAYARRYGPSVQRALVNGAPAVVARGPNGRPASVLGFTVAGGRIVEIDILGDPDRLARLDFAALDD